MEYFIENKASIGRTTADLEIFNWNSVHHNMFSKCAWFMFPVLFKVSLVFVTQNLCLAESVRFTDDFLGLLK